MIGIALPCGDARSIAARCSRAASASAARSGSPRIRQPPRRKKFRRCCACFGARRIDTQCRPCAAQRHGDARSNVVAERHGAQKLRSVNAELFAGCKRGGHDGAAGMRSRRRRANRRSRRNARVSRSPSPPRSGRTECLSRRRSQLSRRHRSWRSWIAARPGGSSEPETMAAIVSRMWCLVFSITSSGSARLRASLM